MTSEQRVVRLSSGSRGFRQRVVFFWTFDPFGFELGRIINGIIQPPIDIYPGPDSSIPLYLTVVDNDLFFEAHADATVDRELWQYTEGGRSC